jgi:hypothetical protein
MSEPNNPPSIHFAGSVYGQVNVNSPNSQQYLALTSDQKRSFRDALEDLRLSVEQMDLTADATSAVHQELQALERAVTGEPPNPSVIQRIYNRISDLAGGTVATLVASLLGTQVP